MTDPAVELETRSFEYLDGLNNNVADLRRHLAGLQQREWELLRNRRLVTDPQDRANIEASLSAVRREREEYRGLLEASRENLDTAIAEYLVDRNQNRKYVSPLQPSQSAYFDDRALNPHSEADRNATSVVIDQHDSTDQHPTGWRLWINSFTLQLLLWQAAIIALYWTSVDYAAFDAPANSVNRFYLFFSNVSFMLLFGFGFLMAYLRKYGFSAVGLTFLITVVCVEWAVLTVGLAKHIGKHLHGNIQLTQTDFIDADFAAAAVLISFGAIIGKVSAAQMLFLSFWEIILYAVNFYINSYRIQVLDLGGSMTIHAFGAFFGLAASMFLSPAKAKEHPDKTSLYYSDIFAMIGTLFLWLYWPSFNAALATDITQSRAITNTFLSLVASTVATFIFSYILRGHGKFDMVDIQNATLAGGVAMGSSADFNINPGGALTLGFAAGVLATVGFVYLSPFLERKIGLQDTCGILNLHGLSALLGGFASAIAIASATESNYGFTFPNGNSQGAHQVYTLLISVGIGLVGGAVVGFATKVLFPAPKVYFQDHVYWAVPVDYAVKVPITDISHN